MTATYVPRAIKRKRKRRRTKAEMEAIRTALYDIIEADNPMTCRQTFYQAVRYGIVQKREREYKQTICRLLAQMRRDGRIPFSWISDNTRWMRGAKVYSGIAEAIEATIAAYRRDLWADQDSYVEVWCEKDALAGIMLDSTLPYRVPLMVAKGYSSITFLQSTGENIAEVGKPAYIYLFTDHDPSGVNISKTIERDLRTFSKGADIHFVRAAVTEQQIRDLNLPTRPTKTKDTRAKSFSGESVDLDAIPAKVLRQMVTDCIEQHIDQRRLKVVKQIEAEEREALRVFADRFADEGGAA